MKHNFTPYDSIDMYDNDAVDFYTLVKFKESIDLKLKNLKVLKENINNSSNRPDFNNIGLHMNLKNNEGWFKSLTVAHLAFFVLIF